MIAPVLWYVIISILGLAAWPLVFRLLPGLPDRGYAFCRSAGLLLTGYVFWLLCSLGLLQNTSGSIILSALVVGSVAVWIFRSTSSDTRIVDWAKDHKSYMLAAEVLFASAFIVWLVVRSFNPELNTTEKPMELMFLNSVSGSLNFPPTDGWLSGYSISYYYFGYVLIAMLVKLAGTPVSNGFNIGIALLFALTLLNSYGLVYNISGWAGKAKRVVQSSLLGSLFVGVIGNLEGFLELVRSLNLPFLTLSFWRWLDIEDLTEPVVGTIWPPQTWRFWWWWRASRVIRDRNIVGGAMDLQPISEFPMFSFILGDMHPHVLALPFVIVALALAFNLLTQRDQLSGRQIVFYSIVVGGLAFLNTWDLPIYFFILVATLFLKSIREPASSLWNSTKHTAVVSSIVLLIGIAAYIVWYLGFTSQAGGILPNSMFPTRFQQFVVMFGPFLIITTWFILDQVARGNVAKNWKIGLAFGGGLLLFLIFVMVSASLIGLYGLRGEPVNIPAQQFLLANVGLTSEGLSDTARAGLVSEAMSNVISYRLLHPITALVLTILISSAVALLATRPSQAGEATPQATSIAAPTIFVLILIVTALMLGLGPEFVFLRDNFSQRLNTIFKFYYAAWTLLAISSACGVVFLVEKYGPAMRLAFMSVVGVFVAAGLVYPVLAIPEKMTLYTRSITDNPPTLDGIDFVRRQYSADYKAITWLQQNGVPGSVVIEAVGGSYSYYGRVSSMTGLPTVIGWANHESQWRGPFFGQLAGGRESVVHEIYDTASIARAQQLLRDYDVTYIFVGSLERAPGYASAPGLAKFERFFKAVFNQNSVAIYRADQPLAEGQP